MYITEPHPNGVRNQYQKTADGWQEWWDNYATSIINNGITDPDSPLFASAQHPLFQTRSFKERVAMARSCIRHLNITTPVLIDEMDNPLWCTYGYLPNCAYFIGQEGTIVLRESWFSRSDPTDPAAMEAAIKQYLGIP